MRKIFTTLKSVVSALVIAAMAFSVSCSYDDTAINDRVQQVENDLAALTERVAALESKLQSEVESLKALINEKVVIVDVTEDEDGNAVIKLSDGKTITVLAAQNALQYRVVDGVLEVSADGQTWVAVEVAPEQVVADVVLNEDGTVTVKLANGEEFTVVKAELIECEATRSDSYVIAGQSKEIPFSINDAVADINVMNQPFGWSATVEEAAEAPEAPEAGDEGGVMPLAAGGKNYVLKVNGPSAELVNAGYAAKEGVVSVHFNTAAGACKVLTVNVTLAEVTMDIDADGNITIVNTIATEQENYWGEKFFDFADFWIGVMPKAIYEQYGNDAIVEAGEYVEATQRSTGLWNVCDLKQYEEGVYEKEVIELHVDKFAGAFYPKYNFELGQEYVFFISLEAEMTNYNVIPLLDNAIFADYKKVLVSAEFVEGSAVWNDLTFKYNLAGYQYYLIGMLSQAEVDEYMAYGEYASVEDFIVAYINGYGLMSAGAILSGNFIDQEIKMSEVAQLSLTGQGPSITAGTTYHFYVYPFNAATEMDLYQHKVVTGNLRYYGTYATAELGKGSFDPAPEYTLNEHVEDNISVDVKLSSDVTCAYYTWFSDSQLMDAENAAYLVLNDIYADYVQFDEYIDSISAEKFEYYGLPNPIYLGIVAINAAGEYVYVEKEFLYVEPEPIALTSFEYKGRNFDIDDNPETSGGDHVYIAKAVDGTELTIGLYYTYADENGVITPGEYDYCANYFNAMYSYWNGFSIIGDASYNGSKMIVTEDTVKIKIKGGNIYLFDKNATNVDPEQPETPEPIEPSASAALVTDTTFGGFNPYDVTFTFENGDQVIVRFNTLGTQYLHLGNWQTDSWQEPHYISQVKYNGEQATITACNVAYENDAYVVTFSVFEYTNYATLNYTFTGAIEGLNAPEACDCVKEPEPEPEAPSGDEDYSDIFQDGTQENPYYYKAAVTPAAGYYEIRFTSDAEGAKPLYLETFNDLVSAITTGVIVESNNWYGGHYNEGQTNVDFEGSTITVTTINSTCLSFDEIALKTDNGFVYYRCPVVQF